MRSHLSYQSKRELLWQMAPRYREASSALKEIILDEFVAATGYVRKYAIRLLNHPAEQKLIITRSRPAHYGPEVQHALHLAWTAANHICAKRLIPFLPTLVASLERHGHLHLSEKCRSQLLTMSPATADRILQPYRKQERHGISTTRSGTLLKKQIPVRPFNDWNETQPGFLEADLVAHCGTHADGSYLYTLTLTDIATGWTECLPLLNRGQEAVIVALKRAQQLLPFPLLGIDTDNGGEFINAELLTFCEQEHITFTRGRPRRSNDQCYVEQKNGQIVRQVVGYDRFEGRLASQQLTELYRALRVYVNCFQPSMKLALKEREGSKVRRTYDQAQTPMQRLLASGILSEAKQQDLLRITEALDPLRLLTQLEHLQKALWRHAVTSSAEEAASLAPVRFSVQQCTEGKVPTDGLPHTPPSLLKQARKKTYQKTGRPHDWRTRKDPFEGEWEQITTWVLVQPELTGVEIFHRLEQHSPGRYRPTQVRTLQRGLAKLRARLLITFEDHWEEEVVNGHLPVPELRAEVLAGLPS
ncbi:Integrase catalytic region [Ktedonobacter racemifer DSM 44963]|uniref:Integrase catalytic region n=1 Tax=Ktedonobacter racemifer DSM 44963 TaxID=485913 RepID=D6U1Y3_KTERA|nr:Integrase catalytic region [Ktedonobacter racemifer DSM 44963]